MTGTGRAPGRLRAVLALGMVLGLGSVGTAARWTDNAAVTGTTFTSGTIDLQLNDANAVTTTTLSMTDMVPGSSSAEVVRVKNAGSVPFTYTITGGLGGADAAAYASAAALRVSVSAGATRSGTGTAATCSGGTALVSDLALTTSAGGTVAGTAQGPVAAGAQGATLCVQVALASAAPSSLQGRTATATFTVTATSAP